MKEKQSVKFNPGQKYKATLKNVEKYIAYNF